MTIEEWKTHCLGKLVRISNGGLDYHGKVGIVTDVAYEFPGYPRTRNCVYIQFKHRIGNVHHYYVDENNNAMMWHLEVWGES